MTISINIDAAWKTLSAAYVNIGGVWKPVQSSYTNIGGVWKQAFTTLPAGTLFYDGDQMNGITDGWSRFSVQATKSSSTYTDDRSVSIRNTINIYLNSEKGIATGAATNNKIDVTNYSKLKLESAVTLNGGRLQVYLHDLKTSALTVAASAYIVNGTTTLNISSLTGAYYISVDGYISNKDYVVDADISRIYLEV